LIPLKHPMNNIIELLKNCRHVLVVSHINPDGDAVGSMMALGLALESLNIKTTLLNESAISDNYSFLPKSETIVSRMEDVREYDAAVILDCGEIERVGKFAAAIQSIPQVVNIDHHVTNTMFGGYQLVDTKACATAEILFHLITKMDVHITKEIATAIYTGILTDTGSFHFSNTTAAVFDICGKMVACGADIAEIAKNIYQTHSFSRMKLLKLALESIELLNDGRVGLMSVSRDMIEKSGAGPHDMDGFIDYPRGIRNVEVAVLFKELGDSRPGAPRHHVSLRSSGDADVALFASQYGGGGHSRAAAFDSDSSVADLKSMILDRF